MEKITLRLNPQQLNFKVLLPSSKSISNRALILNALAHSTYSVENLSDCDDTRVTMNVLNSNTNAFDIGAAGTAMRFLTAFLSKTMGEWTLTGSKRMQQRPIKILVDALNTLGAQIEYIDNEGYPPLKITGCALNGGCITLDGSVSSQYISALMMIAPYMLHGLTIQLEGKIISTPYIHMTKAMMEEYGVQVEWNNHHIVIRPQTYTPIAFSVESDWSAASYWYQIMCLLGRGSITLYGLRKHSYQGDSKVATLFEGLGVNTRWLSDGIELTPGNRWVDRFEFDFTDQPDLAQTFAVTCCCKNIPFTFKGLESLKIKETNRVAALINELMKLGFLLHEPATGMLAWEGATSAIDLAVTPSIATYEDHRMAMAFAPVALLREISIENPSVVSKSYPQFWQHLHELTT